MSLQKSEIIMRMVLLWRFPAINRMEGKATVLAFGWCGLHYRNERCQESFMTKGKYLTHGRSETLLSLSALWALFTEAAQSDNIHISLCQQSCFCSTGTDP